MRSSHPSPPSAALLLEWWFIEVTVIELLVMLVCLYESIFQTCLVHAPQDRNKLSGAEAELVVILPQETSLILMLSR